MSTLFSVVMPVFNRSEYLDRALQSILGQAYKDFEIIVVDDGSDDGEVELKLRQYIESNGIMVLHQRHKGPGAAINYGVSRARGEYVCRLDSDDMLAPEALEVVNAYVQEFPDIDYFYSSRYAIDGEDRVIKVLRSVSFDRKKLLRRNIANHLICWKRQSFLEVQGFDESLCYGEDYDLALRMAERFRFQNITEILYKVRRGAHEDRLSRLYSGKKRSQIVKAIQQKSGNSACLLPNGGS